MGRRRTDSELGRCVFVILFFMALISCCFVYFCVSLIYRPSPISDTTSDLHFDGDLVDGEERERVGEKCCKGIEHSELWGEAVKWGSDFKVNSSMECCMACKDMCTSEDGGSCLCDTWVFCGDEEACGSRFGECWLKKQKDTLDPELYDSGDKVIWTSGHIFGKQEGIVGLETEYGNLRIKLLPDCAPHSVAYILGLLRLRHCTGCRFYRAESRGDSWDLEGNHIANAGYGPPFALLQGTLDAYGAEFKDIPTETSSSIKRGSVAWVDSGLEFFISLANHNEFQRSYIVFGHVLPQDLEIADRITQLPTQSKVVGNIPVSVLETHIPLRFRRI